MTSRRILLACILGAVAWSVPGHAQRSAVPNFNGSWGHNGFGFRVPYITRTGDVVDGHNSAYLKPWTAEAVMRANFAERSGRLIPNTHTTCYPDSTPDVFALRELFIVQTPQKILLIFQDGQQTRHVYMNQPHSAHVTPSWYGESVGHWDGDTLVIDTVGISVNPQARVDRYGTPHTDALHIVERLRFIDGPAQENQPLGRGNLLADGVTVNPNAITGGPALNTLAKDSRTLELIFTVEDPGAFKKPWSVKLDYRAMTVGFEEEICPENNRDWHLLVPTADRPDF